MEEKTIELLKYIGIGILSVSLITGIIILIIKIANKSKQCTPYCTLCGGSDGCGGTCQTGSCATGQTCQSGTCSCTPNCDNSSCGGSDGCDGICQTGSCATGQTCQSGTCSCTPNCDNSSCGGPNGCGEKCSCPSGQTCQSKTCVDCTIAGHDMYETSKCLACCEGLDPYLIRVNNNNCAFHCYSPNDPNLPKYTDGTKTGELCQKNPYSGDPCNPSSSISSNT